MSPDPLTLAELSALLDTIGGFEAQPSMGVGVSGGPDSLALVLLVDRWARRQGGQTWALTVDHGLRTDSAAEVRVVAAWLAARGIAHEVLTWAGDKPRSGIQEAARDARYRLLTEWCRAHGVLHLLIAHHREDQIETHLIRRRAGSGTDGLAAMSAVRELAGCRLVRPLLAVPRARLLAVLAEEQQPFLRDPSNLNPAFERTRLRTAADRSVEAPLDAAWATLRECGGRRIARERILDALIGRAVAMHPAGFAALDPAAFSTAGPETIERLFGRVARCVGGARYPARRARLARLYAALTAAPDRARTLGGCRFVPWRGRLLVLRELSAASPPVRVDPGAHLVWDRRFAVELTPAATSGFMLGYLSSRNASVVDSAKDRPTGPRDGALPRLVRPVLPAFWDERGVAAVPHLCYRRAGVEAVPKLAFQPANPLTTAGFTVV